MTQTLGSRGVKVVVIGGGTGSFVLLSGLKTHTDKITALVSMADDGGSTGILRSELGTLPPGDVRQCLVALSEKSELRDLFSYRFDKGTFEGHAFGNIFLSALEKTTGSFARSVELASDILKITGVVEPMTLSNIVLAMRDDSGQEARGEFEIAHRQFAGKECEFWLEPSAEPNPRAIQAIERADIIVIAPGSLYGSLAPALLVDGVGDALARSSAAKVYIANLVTQRGQTDGFTAADFADEVERLAGTPFLDAVIYNTAQPSRAHFKQYEMYGELSIEPGDVRGKHHRLVGAPLISDAMCVGDQADPIARSRSLLRHDPLATADAICEWYHPYALC
ncbi:hypothetical protein CR983_00165 [Candidatus Saccharibacteria bacterium]|nr:MAG: hypothetical protein CR983_00165 [Candidatus Saccharibacteria bacterium]